MSKLFVRIVSGLVYIVLFIGAILYSQESFIILISSFAVISIWELSKLIQFKNSIPYILVPLIAYYAIYHITDKRTFLLLLITLLSSVRLIYHLFSKTSSLPITFLDKLDVHIRYVLFPFSFILLIPFTQGDYNPDILIYILVLIWTNDSFAFFVGKNLGKRKLFESVSPKKTIEGFVGGLIFSLIAGYVIAVNSSIFSITNWLVIAVLMSVIGTIGDLVESKFKRQANVKDSGNIMPGHGGILDRLDSLLFAAPFVYLYIHFII